MVIEPLVGWYRPLMRRQSVVFPDPDLPTNATIVFLEISTETPLSTGASGRIR